MPREITLSPAPRLRPLTWAEAEAACAFLTLPAVDGETADDGETDGGETAAAASERPCTLAVLLTASGVRVSDPVAFCRAACETGDAGLAVALSSFPPAVVARHVLAAFREACQRANDDARAYGETRRRMMPDAYRSGFATWARQDPEAVGRPSSRSIAADLAARGPADWLILETWPLVRVLRYLEDLTVASFLREIDEMTANAKAKAPAGGRHG